MATLLADQTLSGLLSGKPTTFSWEELLQGHKLRSDELRHFIEVQPALDFSQLQPGKKATDGIRRAAADLDLQGKFGATVELTGQVPMNDDQFSVIRHSALRDTLMAVLGVLIVLWLALRSWKIIVAVFFSLMVGTCGNRRDGFGDGRLVQSDLHRVFCAVCRPWSRLRHSIQRAISQRAARPRQSARSVCGRRPARPAILLRWRLSPRRWAFLRFCPPAIAAFRNWD